MMMLCDFIDLSPNGCFSIPLSISNILIDLEIGVAPIQLKFHIFTFDNDEIVWSAFYGIYCVSRKNGMSNTTQLEWSSKFNCWFCHCHVNKRAKQRLNNNTFFPLKQKKTNNLLNWFDCPRKKCFFIDINTLIELKRF